MVKRFAAVLLIGMVCLFALPAWAEKDEPIQIHNAQELMDIAYAADADYELANDINLAGVNWIPLPEFDGSLDGKGHTISGLTIRYEDHTMDIGLFSSYTGSITNLNIENASVQVSGAANSEFSISILGWPSKNTAVTRNCKISGTIHVTDSSEGEALIYGLFQAEDCVADVDIVAASPYADITGLDECVNCVFKGDIRKTGPQGTVYGVNKSERCTYRGTITSNYAYAICHSASSRFEGKIRVHDQHGTAKIYTIYDSLSGDYYGKNTAKGKITCSSTMMSQIDIEAWMGIFSHDAMDVDFSKGVGNCDVYIGQVQYALLTEYAPEDLEWLLTWSTGDVDIVTEQGDIMLIRNPATTGKVNCISENGEISINGHSCNSGNIFAESGSRVGICAAAIFNSGTVTAYSPTQASAKGVSGYDGNVHFIGSQNIGDIKVIASGDGFAYAVGASGENGINMGRIESQSLGTGWSEACGAGPVDEDTGSINTGAIIAVSNTGFCQALGTGQGAGSFNTGAVTAIGNGTRVCAEGNRSGYTGNSNTGYIYAENNSLQGWADAYGAGGEAYAVANGEATAQAAISTAQSRNYGVSAQTGQVYMELSSHSSDCDCGMSTGMLVLVAEGIDPSDDDHYFYEICAAKTAYNEGGDTVPKFTLMSMPEQVIVENGSDLDVPEDGPVTIELFDDEECTTPVAQFMETFGSLSYESMTREESLGYSDVFLRISADVDELSSDVRDLILTLPEGFSFEEWDIVTEKTFTVPLEAQEWSEVVPVYLLYREDKAETAEFAVSGALESLTKILVTSNPDEGKLYCCPTGGINKTGLSSITVDCKLEPENDLILSDVDAYNQRLALIECALSQAIYGDDYTDDRRIHDSLKNLGFSNIAYFPSTGNHSVASAVAQKKIVVDDTVYNALMLVLRGTVGGEMLGNFFVNPTLSADNEYHADFLNAAQNVQISLSDYIADYPNEIPLDRTRAHICGHSRGAAAANIICLEINGGMYGFRDMAAYCFATPNSMKSELLVGNVHNIVDAADLVAYVPQNYYKYGKTYVQGMNKRTYPESIEKELKFYNGEVYNRPNNNFLISIAYWAGQMVKTRSTNPYQSMAEKISVKVMSTLMGDILKAHGAENYLSWVTAGISRDTDYRDACDNLQTIADREISLLQLRLNAIGVILNPTNVRAWIDLVRALGTTDFYFMDVSCPVNVEVLSSGGNTVARFENHTLISSVDEIVALSAEESHYLVLPSNADYVLNVTGIGEGTMHIGSIQMNEELDNKGMAVYSNVPITQNCTYHLEMDSSNMIGLWVLRNGDGTEYGSEEKPFTLPKKLTVVEEETFANALKNCSVVCPDGLTSIGPRAFADSGVIAIHIPDSVTEIADDAFGSHTPVVYCNEGSFAQSYAEKKGYLVRLKKN